VRADHADHTDETEDGTALGPHRRADGPTTPIARAIRDRARQLGGAVGATFGEADGDERRPPSRRAARRVLLLQPLTTPGDDAPEAAAWHGRLGDRHWHTWVAISQRLAGGHADLADPSLTPTLRDLEQHGLARRVGERWWQVRVAADARPPDEGPLVLVGGGRPGRLTG
jgi:hypothetical protein